MWWENGMTREEAEAALAAHLAAPWEFEDKPEQCRTCMIAKRTLEDLADEERGTA